MPAFWGGVPEERPVRRNTLVRLQKRLPWTVWRRADAPLIRAGISGRGESLLVLAWSAPMLAREIEAGVRLLGRVGIRAGQRVANTLAGGLVTPGSLLLGDVVEAIGALDIPLGAMSSPQAAAYAWELLSRVGPDALVLDATTASVFFEAWPPRAGNVLEAVIWLHRDPPASWPRLPEHVHAKVELHWLTAPEVNCFLAYSCSQDHFHADESLTWIVVDSKSLRPAQEGALLVMWADETHGELSYLVPWTVGVTRCPTKGREGFCVIEPAPTEFGSTGKRGG
ncbi:MAG: hypothetical protein KatS3mg077_0213 [Candidatus Binatia bacterium]|nr:MAG: hypothetical protein KatS3mg077_0213 [Candidatus Binatia bacterium]